MHVLCVRGKILRDHSGIKFIGFALSLREDVVETGERALAGEIRVGQPEPNRYGFTCSDYE